MTALLEARHLGYSVPGRRTSFFSRPERRVILDDVNLSVNHAETLGIIGSSGSGKSTLSRVLTGLVTPQEGEILFRGENLIHASPSVLRRVRPEIQMIFQDPQGALDPRQTVRQIVAEPLHASILSRAEKEARVRNVLEEVALPADAAARLPRAFSGGQRQRIAIARALVTRPSVIIADEAVSALDVSTQAIILNLLLDLQEKHGLSYIFISHDLAVIRHVSHRIAVLDRGKIVETGKSATLLAHPEHAVTRSLIACQV